MINYTYLFIYYQLEWWLELFYLINFANTLRVLHAMSQYNKY
ncbi:hypothetical protein NT01EI_1871 [Edwardsiella ictaluri 93-146]|uniref:Uncharacterized protein n=1 Tax=Edwardsiella ictaluri (strain 93-146) TaxID=634503 RepID=C5BGW9_EDWI9|nr:hypothetical protein NT01EI_1871 [Edwardsiella ictaluri 93-146]